MHKVNPQVYFVAATRIQSGLYDFLEDIGHSEYQSNAVSDADELIEAAGRLCYRSWSAYDEDNKTGTNANVTRIRQDNEQYVQNIIKSAHGSVLEHANVTVLFHNVSRVFTHELVRHRAGMAYSQESLRYVRLDELNFWIPQEIEEDPELLGIYEETVEYLENVQKKLNSVINLEGKSFEEKKKWTSRFRRLAPDGLGTTIMVTGNLRAWRHIVNMRKSAGAEEEIRLVMNQLIPILKEYAPSSFSDLVNNNGVWEYKLNPKP